MDRRHFLQQLSGGAALLSASRVLSGASAKQRIHVGAQTNTWGAPIKTYDHLREVLDALVKLGYEGFETSEQSLDKQAGMAKQCRAAFESRHIEYVAPHCSLRFATSVGIPAQVEALKKTAGYSAEMGAKHLIASGGYARNESDVMPVEQKAELLNQVGKVCQQEGLQFCYHNHTKEFEGDHPEMETLIAQTDPKVVWLNYDVGNAYPIGPKPGDFSAKHYRRILIYHIKDVKQDSNGKQVATDLGEGKIDLRAVVAPLLKSDWKGWLVVEREAGYPNAAEHPEELLRQCRGYIRRIAGV
ncbi:MAG TPA: sugar phosphate isomerase/epimerase family protein [Bryobacteraceae bacterium]|nr:sugar phosphate isomerase/epimerase family protein [Bryobacteraceae bacterium]